MLKPAIGLPPDQLAAVAFALVAVGCSLPILGFYADDASALSWTAMLASTTGLAFGAGRFALAARTPMGGATRALGGSIVAGWLNSVLCFVAFVAFTPSNTELFRTPAVFALVVVAGILYGGGPGLLFGVVFAPLAMVARQDQLVVEVEDRSVLLVGAWTTLVALLFGLGYARLRGAPPSPTASAVLLPVALGTAAMLLVAWTAARLGRRREWLRRVRAGRVANWRVEPLESLRGIELDRLVPLLDSAERSAVLVNSVPAEGYRSAPTRHPIALVPEQ